MSLFITSFLVLFRDRSMQIFLIVGLLILFFVSAYVNIPLAFDGSNPYDFPNYYFGGKRFIEGRPIYDFLETEVFHTLGWHNRVYPADPPFAVIVFSPLAFLSYFNGWIVWAIISTLLFLTSIYLAGKELGVKGLGLFCVLVTAMSSKPFRFLLFSNHIETLVLLFSVIGWILIRRNFVRVGLFMWVLAASMKLFPLLWIVGSVRILGFKKVIEALLGFSIIFLLSGYLVGIENFRIFILEVLPRSQLWYGVISNYSLISIGYAFGMPFVAWGLELGFAIMVLYDLLTKKSWNLDCLWCFTTFASLLLSPLCWWRYLILTFPCFLVLLLSKEIQLSKNVKVFIAILASIIWGWPEIVDMEIEVITILLSSIPLFVLMALYLISRQLGNEPVRSLLHERNWSSVGAT